MCKRTYYHQCEICGCNLDPGEGLICDDCKEKLEKEEREAKLKLNHLKVQNNDKEDK